ncbi:hypothetical protein P3T35_000479 [Kitasatospora sp. GP30]|uniref:hypothetical protein n=1 Tax=Kitasatospora sp. GP30 TaxID=3035084 RepID=UPI000C7017F7|nr:hypothetical protein [Kitasatospora sp. GP30]MDH6138502.1 hypothetical protein [Kitasatospora sp. GP30]
MQDAYQVATVLAAQAGWAGDVRLQSFGARQVRIANSGAGWWIGLTLPHPGSSGVADLAAGLITEGRFGAPLVRSGPLPHDSETAFLLVAKALVRHLVTGSTPGAQTGVAEGSSRIDILPDVKQLRAAVGMLRVAAVVTDPGGGAVPLVRLTVVPDPEPESLHIPADAVMISTLVAGADSTADAARQLADLVTLPAAGAVTGDSWISEAKARFRNAGALVRPTPDGCEVLITLALRRPGVHTDLDRDRDDLLVTLIGEGVPQWVAMALFAWTGEELQRQRRAGPGLLDLILPAAGAIEFVTPGGVRSRVTIGETRVAPR